MNVIVCGLPMCGKTTVGQALAQRLSWNFIDTDRRIEAAYEASTGVSYSCRQIFAREGEPFFRDLEKQHIALLNGVTKSVIAIGGGAMCDGDNGAFLASIGYVVYLTTPLQTIYKRLLRHGFPPFLDQFDPQKALDELAKQRMPAYEKAANCIIATDKRSVQEIVEQITRSHQF